MMLRCLRERTLLNLLAGEGTAAQHSHLTACQRCHSRYQRLARQFQLIEHTLLTTRPPALVVRERFRAPRWWVPATVSAALACALLLGWRGMWRTPVNVVNVSASAPSVGQDEEIYTFLEDAAAPTLFAATETEQAMFSSVLPGDEENAAILADEWPCDENTRFALPECEFMAVSSTIEEF